MKYRKSGACRGAYGYLLRGAALAVLFIAVIGLVVPFQALAYRESMSELWVGGNPGLLVQNQSYSTATRQTLFHTADNVASDTESFAFSGLQEDGISLSQTTAATVAGSQTGYFTSTATSDIIPPGRIGLGFMGTVIGDPFVTGTFFGSGMIYPQMIPFDTSMAASAPVSTGTAPVGLASTSGSGANIPRKSIAFDPAIENDLNVSMDYVDAREATGAANTSVVNSSAGNASVKNATAKSAVSPTPDVIKPGEPFYHQQNKPFSAQLSWPSGPGKAKREKVRNMTGFDRFLMNTVGRSTTDKAFNGTTSYPTYITPLKALVPFTQYQFISDAMKMTLPGTQLMNRAWPL